MELKEELVDPMHFKTLRCQVIIILALVVLACVAMIAAMIVVAYMVVARRSNFDLEWVVPLTLLSVVSLLFVFGLLRSYQCAVAELRYSHNELTMMKAKMLAIDSAGADRGALIRMLFNMDRSPVLKKGETTLPLT